jgi:hypothetical protein
MRLSGAVSLATWAVVRFFPTPAPTPTPVKLALSKLSPASGRIGTVVTITGSGFGGKRGSGIVKFGSKKVTHYLSWCDTKIKVAREVTRTIEVSVGYQPAL